MSNYITLLGAEQVQNAAYSIKEAANTMTRAADCIDGALQRNRIFLDEWLQRLEAILNTIDSGSHE